MARKIKKTKRTKSPYEREDWHREEYEEDPDNAPKRFHKPPKKFEAGFLAKLDRRTEAFSILNGQFQEVIADLGGAENLSRVQVSLVERYCFLEFVMRDLEHQLVTGERDERAALLSRWIQAVNSLTGLAKTVGLERRVPKVKSLSQYVDSRAGD